MNLWMNTRVRIRVIDIRDRESQEGDNRVRQLFADLCHIERIDARLIVSVFLFPANGNITFVGRSSSFWILP